MLSQINEQISPRMQSPADRIARRLGPGVSRRTFLRPAVSYDKIESIMDSRKGDHVLICLVFIPRNCPPGDNRGKMYTTKNLRTLDAWTLPDSEHQCGGA